MTDDELNQRYYDEGWGHIAYAALGVDPVDVESAARLVAGYAANRIGELEAVLRDIAWIADKDGMNFIAQKARAPLKETT